MTGQPKPAIASNLEERREKLEKRQRLLRAEFVEIELDLAITFCQIALSAGDLEKLERNEGHAGQAYESALHFLNTTEAPENPKVHIEDKLVHLRSLLDEVHKKP